MNIAGVVIVLYFVGIIALTYLGVRKQRRGIAAGGDFSSEFFKGGGRLGPIALAILVAAGACSTGTFVGAPGMGAVFGPGFIMMYLGHIPMVLMVLAIFGKKMNIIGRRTDSDSYIDILRHRYEGYVPLVLIVAAAIVIFATGASAAEFVGGSKVIETSIGIPYKVSLIAFTIIITLYIALGGMTGISMVAMLQGIVMTVGSLILLAGYLTQVGSLPQIMTGIGNIDPKLLTPNYGGQFPLVSILNFWCMYGLCTPAVPWVTQSTLTYKDTKTMKQAIIAGAVMCCIWTVFVCVFGGAASRIFNPLLDATRIDYATPMMAFGILPGWLAGVVLSAMAGAGQSTIAALFILMTGTVVTSIYKTYFNPSATEKQIRTVSTITTIVVGAANLIIAMTEPASLLTLVAFAGTGCCCALFPILTMGLFWPRTNKYGAFVGCLFGMVGAIISFSLKLDAPMLYTIPFSFLVVYLVSKATAKPSKETIRVFFGEVA